MNYFLVFDFETDGKDPNYCNPVQLASICIDPYNLEPIESSIFCSYMKPIDIDNEKYFTEERMKTIEWHAKVRETTSEEIIKTWKNAPSIENVWKNFSNHVNRYNPKKTQYNAPYAAGMNIKNFDLIIAARLNEKYKITTMFNYEYTDIRDWAFHALIWDTELKSKTMDSLRKYLGLANHNAHDALQDVKDEAAVISRYLKHYKNLFNKNKYKGSMK